MIINLQTEQPVLIKGFFKKIQEQTCRNEYVVWQKSQTSKTNITIHDNLKPNK